MTTATTTFLLISIPKLVVITFGMHISHIALVFIFVGLFGHFTLVLLLARMEEFAEAEISAIVPPVTLDLIVAVCSLLFVYKTNYWQYTCAPN